MRSQHPGMSQPRPGQQHGFSDIQLLQQHLMYKQLQDIQRQRQLQQLDLGGRQQNSLGQLSDVERQAAVRQSSSPVLSGMPINNASNYTYSNELMGAESRTTNSSLMFLAGNMNWPRCEGPPTHGISTHGISTGPMFSHDQGQMMRPMGIIPPNFDQSLYGTPVSSTRYSLNNYPQPQGLFQNDVMNKAGGDPAEKASMQPVVFNHLQNAQFVVPEHDCSQDGISVAKHGFQGKSLFGNAPVQGINSGSMSGNFKQVNHFARSVGDKEFQDGQEQENWLGKLQQNKVPQIGPSSGVANLDATEAKLLFGTDNDGNWDGSIGESTNPNTGGYLHGNPIQSSDHSSAFPSIQSGSWSALMLDALEASSSDTGIQEEWSGLSFQKAELSTGNHYALLNDNGKQQTIWDDSNLQNASSLTSRPFTLFNDADASPNHYTAPSFQQSSTKFAYEHHERVSADVSHESSQQSSKEANINQLDHIHQRKQFVGSNLQEQTFENASNGVWTGHMYGQPVSTRHSTGMEFNLQKMQLVWDRQQKMPTQNVSSLSSGKSNGWNINQTFAPSEDNTSNIPDNDDTKWRAQNDRERTVHKEKNDDGNKWKVGGNQASVTFPSLDCGRESVKSEIGHPKMHNEDSNMENFAAVTDFNASKLNQEMKQQVFHQHQLNYGTHVAVGSSLNNKADENVAWFQNQLSRDPQTMDSSIYGTDKREEPGERFDHKRESRNLRDVPNEGYTSNHSHPSQHTGSEGCPKENSLLARNDPGPSVTSSQKSSGQSGRKIMGPRRFQYHPMGNLEMDVESAGSHNHALYTRDAYQSVVRGLKNQEQGFVGRSQFASYVVPPSSMNLGKEHFTDLQSNAKAADEIQSRGTIPNHDSTLYSFDASATHVSLNTRSGEASHNMLELLHKVDQSTNNSNFSDNNAPSDIPDEAATDGSACLQQDHSSALHGFGLKLAPPSERQPVADHDMPSQASLQTANYFGSSNANSDAGGKDSKLLSNSSVQSLPPANDVSKSANLDIISSIPEQMNKQPSYSHTEGRSLAFTPSTFPYARNQSPVQQQQLQQQLHHHHHQQQQQQQQISSATGSSLMDQSANLSGNQVGIDTQVKHSSHPRQGPDSYDGNVSDQPAQGSLPTVASRIPPFRLTPSGDTCASATSQFHLFSTGPSQPINSSSHLRSSGQQLPIGEIRSATRSSSTSGMSPQGFSTVLHNVWSSLSAQQRLSLIQGQKIIPKLPQSMSPLPNSMDANSWTPEKADDQSNKKGRNAPSEFGTCSTNSQQFTYAEEYPAKGNSSQHLTPERVGGASKTGGASQGQELWPNHPSDGNSAFAISSLAHLHQQDLSKGKHADDSSLDSLKEHVSIPNNDVQKQNYSLLQQVQAMKGADSDPSNRAGKRLKGADFGATVLRELDATSPCSSFPSDVKMLSFSRKNEDERADTSSQFISREKSSEDLLTYRPHNLQNHTHSQNRISTLTFAGGNEFPQLHSQMAPSWFEQYRSYKNGQTIATNDGPGNFQSSAKVTAQQYFFANVSESMNSSIVVEERDATQLGSLQKSASSTALAANVYSSSPHCIPSNVISNNAVLIPKKRKTATSELLPWYKEVTQGSRRMRNISMAELDWAQATYRLIEKVEDEFEMIQYGSSMTRSRRRLILTTQLMQQLLPSIPARFFSADDTTSYESVTYFLAKLALGDACSLISCSQSDSLVHSNSGNMIPEKIKTSEKERDHFLLKAMEGYIGRSRRLESDLLRLESRSSILDVRVECDDLGRCSIINRLAKFHGRAQTEGTRNSSNPEVPPRRIFPQRHVTAHAVTANLPEGVRCLSL